MRPSNSLHRRHDDASQGAKSRRAGCRAVDDGARGGDPCPGHFCSPCVLSNKRPSSHLPDRHGLEWSRVRIPPSGAVAAVDGYGLGMSVKCRTVHPGACTGRKSDCRRCRLHYIRRAGWRAPRTTSVRRIRNPVSPRHSFRSCVGAGVGWPEAVHHLARASSRRISPSSLTEPPTFAASGENTVSPGTPIE